MTYPRKGHADHLALGDHNAVCFQCGRKFKASELLRHWQGYLVCRQHWEPRHPQDFVKSVPDNMGVRNAQPPADTFIHTCTVCNSVGYPAYAVAGCMIAGNLLPQATLNAFSCEFATS